MAKKALGKGLGAIISTSPTPVDDMEMGIIADVDRIVELEIENVMPNPDQPRTHFNENEIIGLAESIKNHGLIQPISVRKVKDKFMVVAGERRLRASKHAGLKNIRAIVIEAGEQENLTLALIENIQRENLDPIEEAKAYKVLVSRFKQKQQAIAKSVGKDRATVANSLRLLNLPEDIQEGLSEGKINTGHAKVLLSISSSTDQRKMYNEIIEKGLSVRGLENILKENAEDFQDTKNTQQQKKKDAHIRKMEEGLVSMLGTKVEIKHSGSKGKIEISYYSLDDFERIVELLK